MMFIYLHGLYKLSDAVSDYLGVEATFPLFSNARAVLSGERSYQEGLAAVEKGLVFSGRRNLVEDLREFDYALYLNELLGYPDYINVEDSPLTVKIDYDLRVLGAAAWETLQQGDYIPGIFALTILIGIFLSSYDAVEVVGVDFEPVLEAYVPLKTSILANKLTEDYHDSRHQQSN